jgi:hypothetical protein
VIDLTGANLVAYLLRVIRDIVERNPRFKNTLGTVTFPANTIIAWKDVWVSIRNVTTSGTRLSPDYFMCTQQGRVILAKVQDKPGQFIEWTRETDKTRQTPEAGVYYINIDYFNEQTNDIGMTCQQFKWKEGKITNAVGSQVFFRPGIDVNLISMSDSSTGLPVQFVGFNQTTGAFANLLTPVNNLAIVYTQGLNAPAWNNTTTYAVGSVVTFSGGAWIANAASTNAQPGVSLAWTTYSQANPLAGQSLVPFTDFWYQREQTTQLTALTLGGSEMLNVPANISFTITDQDGYLLRPNTDYAIYGDGFIQLATFTPSGSALYCNAIVKLNPLTTPGTNPENILQIDLQPNESLAPGQVFIHTTNGNFPSQSVNAQGQIVLPQLLQPGDWAYWEVRIETPQVKTSGKKWELNSLIVVDPNSITYTKANKEGVPQPVTAQYVATADPTELQGVVQTSAGSPLLSNGQQRYFLPGMVVAIGDQVIVGDQAAIIVNPNVSETYEVFGSKDNITFTLEVKSNDLQTSSDLSETLKEQLLVFGRENAEADGLTIFEVARDFQGIARDPSATAPSYIYTVSVTASADWKCFVPLITRMVRFEITETIANPDFQGKLQMAKRMQALGQTSFLPAYG